MKIISKPHTRLITIFKVAIIVSWVSYYTCVIVAINEFMWASPKMLQGWYGACHVDLYMHVFMLLCVL